VTLEQGRGRHTVSMSQSRGRARLSATVVGMRIVVIAALAASTTAHAQGIDRRYVEEPTAGMALPATPLAGDHDARTVAINPGGIALVRGSELALALDVEEPDAATSAGQGFGAFWAQSVGGRIVPRFSVGLGLEWLRPSRAQLMPDPGKPFRLTLGAGAPLGGNAGVGVTWHHFVADGVLDGTDTFDLGLSLRYGSYLAGGAVLRDVATAQLGGAPVQRRYEAELVVRPLGSDALDAGFGGRFGETRHDVDGWLRASARLTRGVYLQAAVETRELQVLADSGIGRELRGGRGVELSYGAVGATTLVTALRDDRGDNHVLGGTVVLRASSAGPP